MYRVLELFAGVGGFRIGFERANLSLEEECFKVAWSNQWEPTTVTQHASELYSKRWSMSIDKQEKEMIWVTKKVDGKVVEKEVEVTYTTFVGSEDQEDTHLNKDISKVSLDDLPEHEILVGGFPCQDYSVAKSSSKSKGIEGKKGVLWWEIHRIVEAQRPPILFLENVDRLLKSPKSQRGRDFAIMLASLDELGYVVEWREINAADYGMPQRRIRVFILAYKKDTKLANQLHAAKPLDYLVNRSVFAKAFPIKRPMKLTCPNFKLRNKETDDLVTVTKEFNFEEGKEPKSPFQNCGIMKHGIYYTFKSNPKYTGDRTLLKNILLRGDEIPDDFVLDSNDVTKSKGWIYQKGAKSEERKGDDGFTYKYSEGKMTFPDCLESPSRTIITGEGGAGASRFKHVVVFNPNKAQIKKNKLNTAKCKAVRKELGLEDNQWLRRLTPIELERLNMFPDNHTQGVSDSKRAFLMGNALVVGIVEKTAICLHSMLNEVQKEK